MVLGRFDQLPPYAFPRLRALLDATPPGNEPINMSIGEPQHPLPDFVLEVLHKERAGYGKYPPMGGTPDLLDAIQDWLTKRYALAPDFLDKDKHILPLNGTREGLFNACLTVTPPQKNGQQPAVLIPNPFYQCYAGAAVTAGAEPIFLPSPADNNFLPRFDDVPEETLARTACVYLCSPANPQGTVADQAYWDQLLSLADQFNFVVLADECYAEIYTGAPPPGALTSAGPRGSVKNLLVFHSLSKRSNLPGLRSGFVAGDADRIAQYKHFRSYGGAASPLPVQAAAAAAWREESHVEDNRRLYRQKFDIAHNTLGNRFSFYRPDGGFYLWLDVGNGEEAAAKLWKEQGVRVLPGLYLGRDDPETGPAGNPGFPFIRVALVNDVAQTTDALERINTCL